MAVVLSLILVLFVATRAFGWWLEYVNLRHVRNQGGDIPEDFAGRIDEDVMTKMSLYLAEKTQFSLFSSGLSAIAILVFLGGGLLDWYNTWITSLGLRVVASGWLFVFLLYFAVEFLSIPLSLHFTFKIENKFGFNAMTYRLWLADFIKSLLLSAVLLTIILLGGFWLIQYSPTYWWLMFWCLALLFSLFVTYVSPYVIEPLFNKFSPVGDEVLKENIRDLAARAGISVSNVLTMDESKRSSHTNAYFTGFGRTKRIVLFDTLLKNMTTEEILAVLAHEIGHWKKHHLIKILCVTQATTLILLFVASHLISGSTLTEIFLLRADTVYAKIMIVVFLVSLLSAVFKPLLAAFSRSLEREADRYSCDLVGKEGTMVEVLVKLSKDNLSNLFPHPLYALFNYSHPAVLERIRYIRAYCEKGERP
jgi:STE24 endopeptidase